LFIPGITNEANYKIPGEESNKANDFFSEAGGAAKLALTKAPPPPNKAA
jgi:hypothetical protein